MKNISKLLAAIALSAVAGVASATSITGTVFFGGTVAAYDDAAGTIDSTDVLTATLFKFSDVSTTIATEDFSAMAGLAAGSIAQADLDTTQTVAAITSFWTTTVAGVTYSFDLASIFEDSKFDDPSATARAIKGNGVMSIAGGLHDGSVDGIWSFSSQNPGAGGEFSFSASSAPEPAMVLLLATGLIGFGFARRARKA